MSVVEWCLHWACELGQEDTLKEVGYAIISQCVALLVRDIWKLFIISLCI